MPSSLGLDLLFIYAIPSLYIGSPSSIMLIIVFVFLVSDAIAPPPIAIKGVHWAKDGPKFARNVDGYDASCTAKYKLV